jgi:hypothetical protein
VTTRQLRVGGIELIQVPRPADVSADAESGVAAVLLRARASCLAQAFVRQAWFAARGSARAVVIGVSRVDGFAAHAWLDGDPVGESDRYLELVRRA